MAILSASTAVNDAVAGAKSLPGLINNLQAIDPALATQLEAKPLLASKTPWGTLAAGVIGWASARYGLGLDANTTALIAGVCVLAGSYAMRAITKQPTAGLVTVPPPVVSADTAPVAKTLGLVALLFAGLSLSACTAAQQQTARTALDDVRLFCATQDAVVALSTASGTPVLAKGQTKAYVDAACALAGGVAVSPPGAAVTTVTVAVPPL